METVTIPKPEYELLIKCKNIVESDFEERLTPEFIEKVKRIEENVQKGKVIKLSSKHEMKER